METTSAATISCACAVFTSDLMMPQAPDRTEITWAIADSLRRWGGPHSCAAAVAQEYGDHPETAARRMRWALTVVRQALSVTEQSAASRSTAGAA